MNHVYIVDYKGYQGVHISRKTPNSSLKSVSIHTHNKNKECCHKVSLKSTGFNPAHNHIELLETSNWAAPCLNSAPCIHSAAVLSIYIILLTCTSEPTTSSYVHEWDQWAIPSLLFSVHSQRAHRWEWFYKCLTLTPLYVLTQRRGRVSGVRGSKWGGGGGGGSWMWLRGMRRVEKVERCTCPEVDRPS